MSDFHVPPGGDVVPHQLKAPVGAVVFFAGKIASHEQVPDPQNFVSDLELIGWMLCDGRSLSIAKYPQLYAVLGTLYGGEVQKGIFKIPDYSAHTLKAPGEHSPLAHYVIKCF